jgi:hypothetical protein
VGSGDGQEGADDGQEEHQRRLGQGEQAAAGAVLGRALGVVRHVAVIMTHTPAEGTFNTLG